VSATGQPRVRHVRSFEELRSTRFADGVNALCWERALPGDYAEVIAKLGPGEGIVALEDERIRALDLTPAGRLAAEAMLADQQLLRDHDLAPSQARNLERATGAEVLDRASVILSIFQRHARTPRSHLGRAANTLGNQ
jgi:hypothetical protein